jgi:hypothetical protein
VTGNSRARVALIALMLLAASRGADAQSDEDAVNPDRPDVTNGTHIVDVGLVQIEFGGLYTRDTPGPRAISSPLTARVGIFDWLEARIGTDGVMTQADGESRATGFGNVQLGAKLRLWADPGGVPVLSILPTINLPTANSEKGLGSGDTDLTVIWLTGTDIGKRAHIDVNYGIGSIGAGAGRPHFAQHLASASLSCALTARWNPYIETFWLSRQDPESGSATFVDAGAIYMVSMRFAIDGGLQIGLRPSASYIALFSGISVVVGQARSHDGVHARQRRGRAQAKARRG